MATHYDDEAELENLKTLWKDNWKSLAAGLVVGLGAILGWQGWKDYQNNQALQASQIYEDMKKALTANKTEDGVKLGERLMTEHASAPYASAAALKLASLAVEQGKFDVAGSRLHWVVQNSNDDGLKQLARLREARVLWQQKKLDEALKLLDGDAGGYAALYDELRGDIKLAQGDRAAARTSYEKALQTAGENAPSRDALQHKLDDLAAAQS